MPSLISNETAKHIADAFASRVTNSKFSKREPNSLILCGTIFWLSISEQVVKPTISMVCEVMEILALDALFTASGNPLEKNASASQYCLLAETRANRNTETAVSTYRKRPEHVLEKTLNAIHEIRENKNE